MTPLFILNFETFLIFSHSYILFISAYDDGLTTGFKFKIVIVVDKKLLIFKLIRFRYLALLN